MSKRITRTILALLALTLALPLCAQDQPAPGLTKNGDVYAHEVSKSNFTLPAGSRIEPATPTNTGRTTLLGVRHGPPPGQSEPAVDVTISWSPLIIKMDETVAQESLVIGQVYGPDKVTKAEATMSNDKPGHRIKIDNGPTRNGKEVGVIYLFEAGPDEKTRWKIRVRATVHRLHADEHLKLVEALVQNIKW